LYIEASSPRKAGDTALLVSPVMQPSQSSIRRPGQPAYTLWVKTDEEGNRWEQGEASIPPQTVSYQVRLLQLLSL